MHFALTEEQTAFGEVVGEVLDRECGPDVVRSGWPDADHGPVDRLWRLLGETGLFSAISCLSSPVCQSIGA